MEQDAYHVIARSAFGELYFWGENSCQSLQLFAPGSYCIPEDTLSIIDDKEFEARLFFGSRMCTGNDFADMFAPALNKLGRLRHDEMYGFVPALALGRPATLPHLQKVNAVEHLVLLAQLASLEVIEQPPLV